MTIEENLVNREVILKFGRNIKVYVLVLMKTIIIYLFLFVATIAAQTPEDIASNPSSYKSGEIITFEKVFVVLSYDRSIIGSGCPVGIASTIDGQIYFGNSNYVPAAIDEPLVYNLQKKGAPIEELFFCDRVTGFLLKSLVSSSPTPYIFIITEIIK